jgi:hypothetical protein
MAPISRWTRYCAKLIQNCTAQSIWRNRAHDHAHKNATKKREVRVGKGQLHLRFLCWMCSEIHFLCRVTSRCMPLQICMHFSCAFLLRCSTLNLNIQSASSLIGRIFYCTLQIQSALKCRGRFTAQPICTKKCKCSRPLTKILRRGQIE